jgi:hypothetical protein
MFIHTMGGTGASARWAQHGNHSRYRSGLPEDRLRHHQHAERQARVHHQRRYPPAAGRLPERLRIDRRERGGTGGAHGPTELSIEQVFLAKSADAALKLGQARGAAIVPCVTRGLEVSEYSARQIKQSVVGTGRGGQDQVQHMVRAARPAGHAPGGCGGCARRGPVPCAYAQGVWLRGRRVDGHRATASALGCRGRGRISGLQCVMARARRSRKGQQLSA